jgi:hypothetical protein
LFNFTPLEYSKAEQLSFETTIKEFRFNYKIEMTFPDLGDPSDKERKRIIQSIERSIFKLRRMTHWRRKEGGFSFVGVFEGADNGSPHRFQFLANVATPSKSRFIKHGRHFWDHHTNHSWRAEVTVEEIADISRAWILSDFVATVALNPTHFVTNLRSFGN